MCIQVNQLSFKYDESDPEYVLNQLSLTFEKGRFYGILGPNGSGKSTLLKLMSGIVALPKVPHQIMVEKLSIEQYSSDLLAQKIAFVPQMFSMKYAFTVKDILLMGRYPYIKRMASPSEKDYALVEEAIEATNLKKLKNRFVTELSGGEIQRVLIARAVVQDTPWIFLDEPISHLDIHYQYEIMELLAHLCKTKRKTVISVLHDLNVALNYCDEVALLKHGKLVAFGPTAEVMNDRTLATVYDLEVKRMSQGERTYVFW